MSSRFLRRLAPLAGAAMLLAASVPSPAAASPPFAEDAFQRIWERYDRPVELAFTTRSWTWGPNTFYNGPEPYKQGRNGERLVQYFDKTRMEINDRSADRDDPYFVTNGLLVREMASGKVALGEKPDEVADRAPATQTVAGDPSGVNGNAPTYASFREVISLAPGENPAPNRINQYVTATLDKNGEEGSLPESANLSTAARISNYDQNLRHNIPDKLWEFMNQKGMVYDSEEAQHYESTVYQPWVDVMGVPISEPYWVRTKLAGAERWVLVQLFERRVLTYTPTNPEGFKVEMGNVGQHYYWWRYEVPEKCEETQPVVTSWRVSNRTSTSARIIWTLNKPTDGRLEYGTTNSYGFTTGSTRMDTEHAVHLTDLKPNTTYHFRFLSRDCGGRTVSGENHTFTTLAAGEEASGS